MEIIIFSGKRENCAIFSRGTKKETVILSVCRWWKRVLEFRVLSTVNSRLAHHINSVQKEQKTGCLKNLATNLCPLMMWHFCFRMAPRRPVSPLWFSWGFPSFEGSSVKSMSNKNFNASFMLKRLNITSSWTFEQKATELTLSKMGYVLVWKVNIVSYVEKNLFWYILWSCVQVLSCKKLSQSIHLQLLYVL